MIGYQPKGQAKAMVGKPPAGRYRVVIKGVEHSRSQSNTCDRMSFQFEVIDGPYTGKNIYCNLNLNHTTSEASNKNAEEKMDALCWALNLPRGWTPDTVGTICNIPILLDVYMGEFNGKEKYEIGLFDQVPNKHAGQLPGQKVAPPAQPPSAPPAPNNNINTAPATQPKFPAWSPPGPAA